MTKKIDFYILNMHKCRILFEIISKNKSYSTQKNKKKRLHSFQNLQINCIIKHNK